MLIRPRPEAEEEMLRAKNSTVVSCSRPPSPFVELRQMLPGRVSVIPPFVDQMMRFIHRLSPPENDRERADQIEAALCENLAAAIVQRNHTSPDEGVYVVCRCSLDGEVSISIGESDGAPEVTKSFRPAKPPAHIGRSRERGGQVTEH